MPEEIQTVRYCLVKELTGYLRYLPDHGAVVEDSWIKVPASEDKPVFLDIISKPTDHIWEVKLYYQNGTVIKSCFIYPKIFDSIKIFNMHLLFDGRFNT